MMLNVPNSRNDGVNAIIVMLVGRSTSVQFFLFTIAPSIRVMHQSPVTSSWYVNKGRIMSCKGRIAHDIA